MNWTWILSVAMVAAVFMITPGPNNIIMANSGAVHGVKKTLPFMLGAVFGPLLILMTVACGGVLFLHYAAVRYCLRIICLLYLLWIAYKIITSKPPGEQTTKKPLGFLSALAMQWVNIKVWSQYIIVVTLYTHPHQQYLLHILGIMCIFVCVSIPCAFLWMNIGKAVARYLRHKRHYLIFNCIMASLLLLASVPAIFEALA